MDFQAGIHEIGPLHIRDCIWSHQTDTKIRAEGYPFSPYARKLAGLVGINADALLGFRALELHLAMDRGKQSEISANANICAGMKLGAALADKDAARGDDFAAIAFDAAHLGLAIATVTR
jgi:hypothetical protein